LNNSPPATPTALTCWLERHAKFLLAVATVACLLPFADKAIHIDDPLFVWTGRHMRLAWRDPFGFDVNWYGWSMPMHEVTKNPPLASGYIALVTSIFGESELTLHLAFLPFAIAAVLGTYALAQRFCAFPFQAALALLCAPVFMVSGTTLMCDLPMVALWVWAVVLWIRGLDNHRASFVAFAGVLMGAAALTKYFGIALVPLLLAYSFARRVRIGWWWLPYLLIPVALAGAYEWTTRGLYGHGLFWEAFSYTQQDETRARGAFLSKLLTALSFTGGCGAIVLICAPMMARLKPWRWGIIGAVILCAVLCLGFGSQSSFFALAGLCVLALPILDLKKQRSADSLLLLLWVYGTFFFSLLNWTINGRSILPMMPAVAILLLRSPGTGPALPGRRLNWCLGAAATLSLLISFADYRLAEAARAGVREIATKADALSKGTIWFQGHWGFQYYAEAQGWRAFDSKRPEVRPGDLIVLPFNNTNLAALPPESFERQFILELPVFPWLSTMNRTVGAGFYTDKVGPLPFGFGIVPPEKYFILRFK
jgi:4-amino-4-deoxy-L-arabinose transferase-like glycosyltransferase